jgi:hypothetical protein
MLKAFFSPQEFSTRKTKDISRDPSIHPSIHPKENVRQLLCTKSVMSIEENGLTYGEHIGYAEI